MQLEEITAHIDPVEGWNDVFLKIIDKTNNENSVIFTCQGLYNGFTLGLKVEVKKNMEAGLLASGEINRDAFYRNGISLLSIGVESNVFLRALSELYNFPTTKPFIDKITNAMAFSLNESDVDLAKSEKYNFKLFFNDESETHYCEIFCNIDLAKGIIEFHEKDHEYRENIIKSFAGILD